jgi:hypothetical protein
MKSLEFTKLMLLAVMLTYFIAVGIGVYITLRDYSQFPTLATLVGAPVAAGMGFYCWKAKAENIAKYRKENPAEAERVPFDPANMT